LVLICVGIICLAYFSGKKNKKFPCLVLHCWRWSCLYTLFGTLVQQYLRHVSVRCFRHAQPHAYDGCNNHGAGSATVTNPTQLYSHCASHNHSMHVELSTLLSVQAWQRSTVTQWSKRIASSSHMSIPNTAIHHFNFSFHAVAIPERLTVGLKWPVSKAHA
jgi:hypothetical protein